MRTLSTLALALAAASALTGCRGQIFRDPPVHPIKNMDQQHRIDSQEPHDFWADGRGNRAYVEGTVRTAAYNEDGRPCTVPEANPAYCTGEVDGAFVSEVPGTPVTAELLDRGEERFNIYCTACHDRTGGGNGTVSRRGLAAVTYHSEFMRSKPVGSIYKTITYGGAVMKPYAAQIPVEDRWAIAAYVKALQVARYAGLDDVPAEVAASNGWN